MAPTLPVPPTPDALAHLLAEHGVDVSGWGTGEAKTIAHLHGELLAGECSLTPLGDGLFRTAHGACLHVVCEVDGVWWRLHEAYQRFADGRERVRDFDHSLAEKLTPDEDADTGARRALVEELGVDAAIAETVELIGLPADDKVAASQSYPGLTSDYHMAHWGVLLPERAYRPEGYVEEQADKSTVFTWARCERPDWLPVRAC